MTHVWIEVRGRSLKDRFLDWVISQEPSIVPVRSGPFHDLLWSSAYKPEDAERIVAWLKLQTCGSYGGWTQGLDPHNATNAFRRWLLKRHPSWGDMSSAVGTRAAMTVESRCLTDLLEFTELVLVAEQEVRAPFVDLVSWIPEEYRSLLVPPTSAPNLLAVVTHARTVVLDHLTRAHGKRCVCAEDPPHEVAAVTVADGLPLCERHVPLEEEFGLALTLLRVLTEKAAEFPELKDYWGLAASRVWEESAMIPGTRCQHAGCQETPEVAVARIALMNVCERHLPVGRFALARTILELLGVDF